MQTQTQMQQPYMDPTKHNTVLLTKYNLPTILSHLASLLPRHFPHLTASSSRHNPPPKPLTLVVHGGAALILHPTMHSTRQSTRDVDFIGRGLDAEMGPGSLKRLKKCIRATAKAFSLGADWMNDAPDVALPMETNPTTRRVHDPIAGPSLTPDNAFSNTVFTSNTLVLISVHPFWGVALKMGRYNTQDAQDVYEIMMAGLSQGHVPQWTEEFLMTSLRTYCSSMGYDNMPTQTLRKFREKVRLAVHRVNNTNALPPPMPSYPTQPPHGPQSHPSQPSQSHSRPQSHHQSQSLSHLNPHAQSRAHLRTPPPPTHTQGDEPKWAYTLGPNGEKVPWPPVPPSQQPPAGPSNASQAQEMARDARKSRSRSRSRADGDFWGPTAQVKHDIYAPPVPPLPTRSHTHPSIAAHPPMPTPEHPRHRQHERHHSHVPDRQQEGWGREPAWAQEMRESSPYLIQHTGRGGEEDALSARMSRLNVGTGDRAIPPPPPHSQAKHTHSRSLAHQPSMWMSPEDLGRQARDQALASYGRPQDRELRGRASHGRMRYTASDESEEEESGRSSKGVKGWVKSLARGRKDREQHDDYRYPISNPGSDESNPVGPVIPPPPRHMDIYRDTIPPSLSRKDRSGVEMGRKDGRGKERSRTRGGSAYAW